MTDHAQGLPHGDQVRASDTDRENVAEMLRQGYAEGRLNRDELDERCTAAYTAMSCGDLRKLIADLPADFGIQPVPPQASCDPRIFPVWLVVLLVAMGIAWLVVVSMTQVIQ
jgi:hypothetical protein